MQDLAAALDEEDIAKFTDAVKEYDSMTQLVKLNLPFQSYPILGFDFV